MFFKKKLVGIIGATCTGSARDKEGKQMSLISPEVDVVIKAFSTGETRVLCPYVAHLGKILDSNRPQYCTCAVGSSRKLDTQRSVSPLDNPCKFYSIK